MWSGDVRNSGERWPCSYNISAQQCKRRRRRRPPPRRTAAEAAAATAVVTDRGGGMVGCIVSLWPLVGAETGISSAVRTICAESCEPAALSLRYCSGRLVRFGTVELRLWRLVRQATRRFQSGTGRYIGNTRTEMKFICRPNYIASVRQSRRIKRLLISV